MGYAIRLCASLSAAALIACGSAQRAPAPPPRPASPPAAAAPQPEAVATALGALAYLSKSADPASGAKAAWMLLPSKSGRVDWRLYDEFGATVRAGSREARAGDTLRFEWDGRDSAGAPAPADAYYLAMEQRADSTALAYDPRWTTGGESVLSHDVMAQPIDSLTFRVDFSLPVDCRANMYFGIQGGALVAQPVWMKTYPRGRHSFEWKGRQNPDSLDLIHFRNMVHSVSGYALPENALLVVSGAAPDFLAGKPAAKPPMERLLRPVTMPARHPVTSMGAPRFALRIVNPAGTAANGLAQVAGKVLVQIVMEDKERLRISPHRFELMFFSDFFGIFEDEEAALPFTFEWDVSRYSPGRHFLTCNIATYSQSFGARTLEVEVANSQGGK